MKSRAGLTVSQAQLEVEGRVLRALLAGEHPVLARTLLAKALAAGSEA